MVFGAAFPTAHTLACLRFAGVVTATVARLDTGWMGSPLAERDSHPLDVGGSFIETPQPPLLFDRHCLPNRNTYRHPRDRTLTSFAISATTPPRFKAQAGLSRLPNHPLSVLHRRHDIG